MHHLRSREKPIIIKVRAYFEAEKQQGVSNFVSQPVKRTAECLGVSDSIFKRVSKEGRSSDDVASPKKRCGRPEKFILDEFCRE